MGCMDGGRGRPSLRPNLRLVSLFERPKSITVFTKIRGLPEILTSTIMSASPIHGERALVRCLVIHNPSPVSYQTGTVPSHPFIVVLRVHAFSSFSATMFANSSSRSVWTTQKIAQNPLGIKRADFDAKPGGECACR
jgi:hypothetical protein